MAPLAPSMTDADQAVSLAFTLGRGNFAWDSNQPPSRFAHVLNGIEDLLWLCADPRPTTHDDGMQRYDRDAFIVNLGGTTFNVRFMHYNSPLEIVTEIIQHGIYGVAPVAVASTVLSLLKKWAEVRTELARSSSDVAKARLEQAAYELIRREIVIPPAESPAAGAEAFREERIRTAADALVDISEARQLE